MTAINGINCIGGLLFRYVIPLPALPTYVSSSNLDSTSLLQNHLDGWMDKTNYEQRAAAYL